MYVPLYIQKVNHASIVLCRSPLKFKLLIAKRVKKIQGGTLINIHDIEKKKYYVNKENALNIYLNLKRD